MDEVDKTPIPSGEAGERKRKLAPTSLLRLLGPALLIVLLYLVDLRQVFDQLRGVSLGGLATATLAFLCLLACRTERWMQFLIAADLRVHRRDVYPSCVRSIWLGLITPGRIGEFKRGLDLKKFSRTPLSVGWSLVFVDLLTDVAVAIILFSFVMLSSYVSGQPALELDSALWLWLALMAPAIVLLRPSARLVGRLLNRVGRLAGVGALMVRLGHAPSARLLTIVLLAAGTLTFYTIMMMALMRGVEPSLTYLNGLVIVSVAFVMGMIPITYFGLGTREAALIALFVTAGRTPETAMAVSLTFVAAQLLGAAISIAAEALLRLVLHLRGHQ